MAQYPDAARNTLAPTVHIATLVDTSRNTSQRLMGAVGHLSEQVRRLGVGFFAADRVPVAETTAGDPLTALEGIRADVDHTASIVEAIAKSLEDSLTPRPPLSVGAAARPY